MRGLSPSAGVLPDGAQDNPGILLELTVLKPGYGEASFPQTLVSQRVLFLPQPMHPAIKLDDQPQLDA